MKLLQQHDKMRPWRMALLRKVALAPLEAASTFFQTYLKTFEEVYWPWQKGDKK